MSLTTLKFVPHAARTFLVSVTGYEHRNPVGVISNKQLGVELAFHGATELLLGLEELLDEIACPQAATESRSLTGKKLTSGLQPAEGPAGEALATFHLQVLFRQNSSWQGNLSWLEGNAEAAFRSALECLKLMDSVLATERETKRDMAV